MDWKRERPLRPHWVLLAGACSAVMFYFGTGLTPVPVLTWLAPLPVLLVSPRLPAWVTAGVAFLVYVLGTTNSWGWYSFSYDLPMWPAAVLVIVGMSSTFTLTVWLHRALLVRGRVLLAVLVAPAAWVTVLYLVGLFNPQGVQGTLATTQADSPVLLQTVSVTGALGIEYLVLLVPSALAVLLAPAVRTAARVRVAAIVVAVLAVTVVGGVLRLANRDNSASGQRVALVASAQRGWAADIDTAEGRVLLTAYLDQIAVVPDGVRTIVLPEAAFGSRESRPASLVEPMSRLAKARGSDIVVGFAHWAPNAKYNYALTFPATGGEPVSYLKHHDMVSPRGRDLVIPATDGIRTGIMICGDVNHRNPSAGYAAAGAQMLAVPASDEGVSGWQHSRTGLLRGAENGVAIAWSGRQTRLMLSDGWGHVLAEAQTGESGPFSTVVAEVSAGPGATPYTRLGDWFAWLCAALTLGGLITVFARRATG